MRAGIIPCRLMIDAGTWSGNRKRIEPFIADLKSYLGNYADVLIVTHEHKDHVHAFDVCEDLFTDEEFSVGEIWMGWTENDRVGKVKSWKDEYGEKKKALGIAANKLHEIINSPEYQQQFYGSLDSENMLKARKTFSKVLNGFAELHLPVGSDGKVYKGGLVGMDVVKKKIKANDIKYFKPGEVISEIGDCEGVKVYVLGPPELYDDVKKEAGEEGESYQHNKLLRESEAFRIAINNFDNATSKNTLPFDDLYAESSRLIGISATIEEKIMKEEQEKLDTIKGAYNSKDWRKIDFDWLYSAGAFALRMNGLTNNLSLALAIEFTDNKRVMLFPGDAEFGSWASWHKIKWDEDKIDLKKNDKGEQKHFTEELLNRTVFYKVAHHLSHNGTAQKQGLEMMKHKDLAAMVTLDYKIINDGWTSTMPNRALLKEVLLRTKGRLIIMNEEDLFFDFNKEVSLTDKIKEAKSRMSIKERKAFERDLIVNELYLQYTVNA